MWNFADSLIYYLIFNSVFYASNFILYVLDITGILFHRKLQPKHTIEIAETYKKCLPTAIINTCIYNIPAILTLPIFVNWYGVEFSWIKTIFDLVASYILMDFFYYATHRILHMEKFYQRFHKKHHEITAPVGLTATYLTFVDYYSNILSIYLPPIILSSDRFTIILWIIISTMNTVFIGHSGYSPLASFHDNHHKYFNCNYGVGILADRIFGSVYKSG